MIKEKEDNAIEQLALDTITIGKQAIIFTPSRASAEKTAQDISKLTSLDLPELEKEILKALSTPTTQCRKLSHCIKKGIAFHHAGLAQKQKDLIEEEFKTGNLRIICCTPTLAAGLSLPAFRVIIKSLKRFTGHGMDWIPVLEYLQMAGRAGRPEYEKEGQSIIIASDEEQKEEVYDKYILGQPEEIYSKLAVEPVLRTYLLSLISSGIIRNEKSMYEFFSRTFWAQQFGDLAKLKAIMQKMLVLLQGWGFITIENSPEDNNYNQRTPQGNQQEKKQINQQENSDYNGFVSANTLSISPKKKSDNILTENSHLPIKSNQSIPGKNLKPTILGKRISELYLDPLTAKHFLDSFQGFDQNKTTFSLLQMISHTLELRPLLRTKAKEQNSIQETIAKNCNTLLKPEPSVFDIEYPEFVNSIKTALFFEAWINEYDEDYLLEHYDIRPGEIKAKLETADWLLYASAELAKICNHRALNQEINKVRIRIKHGIKEELLALIKLKGV